MPAGVSGFQYVSFFALSFVAMYVGANAVHSYYKPLQDMDELVKAEKVKILAERAMEAKQSESTAKK